MSTQKKSKILLKHDTTMTAIKFEKYIFRIYTQYSRFTGNI